MFEQMDISHEKKDVIQNLSRQERAIAVERFKEELGGIADVINDEAGMDLADSSCRVQMVAFSDVYDKRTRKEDRRAVMNKRLSSSGIVDTDLYREAREQGRENPAENTAIMKFLDEYEEQEKQSNGQLAEMVATIVLHKAIGDKYLVIRTSQYDDYENGVDTIVVDKRTGEVICAFDDVVERARFQDDVDVKERYNKKVERSKEKLRKNGGMKVKYGITYTQNEGSSSVQLSALDHVPTFCLSFERLELYGLVRDMKSGGDELGEVERAFLENLRVKLADQGNEFEQSGFIEEAGRLEKFRASI